MRYSNIAFKTTTVRLNIDLKHRDFCNINQYLV